MKYGLPYMGSKNVIAEWIIRNLPRRKHLYDLFAGGCAITHCALVSGKFKNIHANDITDVPYLFRDSVYGMYKNETRWISRTDFEHLKETDRYVRVCWSFGNNQKRYIYSKEVEEYKKALHYAIVFRDYSLIDKYDERLKTIIDADDIHTRRLNCKKNYGMLLHIIPGACLLKDLPYSYTPKFKPTNSAAPENEINKFLGLPINESKESKFKRLQRFEQIESLERLERLQNLQSIKNIECINFTQGDYREIEILPDSVIYCDIPYKSTMDYLHSFDYDAFYEWCRQQTEPIIISEYNMPNDFICIAENHHQNLYSSDANNTITERLFIPYHQSNIFNISKQLSLF